MRDIGTRITTTKIYDSLKVFIIDVIKSKIETAIFGLIYSSYTPDSLATLKVDKISRNRLT